MRAEGSSFLVLWVPVFRFAKTGMTKVESDGKWFRHPGSGAAAIRDPVGAAQLKVMDPGSPSGRPG